MPTGIEIIRQYDYLAESHPEDFRQMAHWINKLYNLALDSLFDQTELEFGVTTLYLRLSHFPHLVLIYGRPLSAALPENKTTWINNLVEVFPKSFNTWYDRNIIIDAPETRRAVTDRAKRFFVQWWHDAEGQQGNAIPWGNFDADLTKFISGETENLSGAFVALHNGIQIAVLEEFAQTTAPSDLFGNSTNIVQ